MSRIKKSVFTSDAEYKQAVIDRRRAALEADRKEIEEMEEKLAIESRFTDSDRANAKELKAKRKEQKRLEEKLLDIDTKVEALASIVPVELEGTKEADDDTEE